MPPPAEAPAPFPWDAALHHGLGVLRLSPGAFWAMTPRELARACAPAPSASPVLSRAAFDALMRAHPDA